MSSRPSMDRGLTPAWSKSCRFTSSTMVRTSRVFDACAITNASTMPMISATSRTTMSSPFLSSAARAAICARSVLVVRSGSVTESSGVRRMELTSRWRSASRPGSSPTRDASRSTRRSARRSRPMRRQPPHLAARADDDACGSSRAPRSSPSSVETTCTQYPCCRRRYEEVDGFARGDATPQLRRRYVQARHANTDGTPPGRRCRGCDVLSVDDGQGHGGSQRAGPVPRVDRRRDVASDDQEELGGLGLPAQRLDGIDRVRRPAAVDLEAGSLEPDDAVDRRLDHLEPGLRRRAPATALLPGISGHHDEYPVELELVARGRGRGEMRDVHGVESAAENTEALHSASVREVPVNAVLRTA